MRFRNTKSTAMKSNAAMGREDQTRMVVTVVSLRVGQVIRAISFRTWPKNRNNAMQLPLLRFCSWGLGDLGAAMTVGK